MLRLHTYFRSSAAYRVRIALALKALPYETFAVHLLRGGGEQHGAVYRALNPAGLVPTLEVQGEAITQSLAIIEYLDEMYPAPALLPPDPLGRARVRALALSLACDVHPLGNLRVLNHLGATFDADDAARKEWAGHWARLGLAAFEQQLQTDGASGRFCHGDTPGLADCCLVPQVFNARRFGVALEPFPNVQRIAAHCEALESFQSAHPTRQPDAV